MIFYCYTRECFSVTTVAYYPWVNNTLIREGSEFMGRWGGGLSLIFVLFFFFECCHSCLFFPLPFFSDAWPKSQSLFNISMIIMDLSFDLPCRRRTKQLLPYLRPSDAEQEATSEALLHASLHRPVGGSRVQLHREKQVCRMRKRFCRREEVIQGRNSIIQGCLN